MEFSDCKSIHNQKNNVVPNGDKKQEKIDIKEH